MPAFRNRVLGLAQAAGAHRVHKTQTDQRLAMTPEDLCEFAVAVIANRKELVDAAKRDCYSPRRYSTFVRGWWDRYCQDNRDEPGAGAISAGVSEV
jgi:hypothetical protein